MLKTVGSEVILFAYREVPQAAIGFLPFELVFECEVWGPLDILKEGWEAGKRASEIVISHVLSLRECLGSMTELVKEHTTRDKSILLLLFTYSSFWQFFFLTYYAQDFAQSFNIFLKANLYS